MRKIFKLFFVLSALVVAGTFAEASPFENFDSIREYYRFDKALKHVSRGAKIRVAILDKGFDGLEAEIGKTLPAGTVYRKGSVALPESLKSNHGLRMAQILTEAMFGDRPSDRLELRLYNVYGYTNLTEAIDDLVTHPPDLVLYSEVWELGGNGDGKGFINAQVDRALDAGVFWVNAAGNFGGRAWNSGVKNVEDTDWVKLPNENNAWKIACEAPSGKTCALSVTLTWNDFKDDASIGTDKDLDLALTDDMLNILQTSTLRQSSDPSESRPGYSKYPREQVTENVKAGTYFLRVKNVSGNFRSRDRLRLSADGDFLKIASFDEKESLMNPADNPRVLTVGASDSDRSSRSENLGKPDLFAISSIKLEDGNEFRGSSNAAALTAAAVALWKMSDEAEGSSRKAFLRERTGQGRGNGGGAQWNQGFVSLNLLGFGPTNGNCFAQVNWPNPAPAAYGVLSAGGALVQTTDGLKIMTPFDPWQFAGLRPQFATNDRLVLTAGGFIVAPRGQFVPPDVAEVFARPFEAGLCGPSTAPQNGGRQLLPF